MRNKKESLKILLNCYVTNQHHITQMTKLSDEVGIQRPYIWIICQRQSSNQSRDSKQDQGSLKSGMSDFGSK